MKRINEYKKLFNVEKDINLKEIKSKYRNLVKAWHPDLYQNEEAMSIEAERMSRVIIDAYHFLVSIAPETKAATIDAYTKTTSESGILDYKHKGQVLEISFVDGSVYEYFGVNAKLFSKMINSGNLERFARRNIFNAFLYRKSKKVQEKA
jgi:DnaJ-class molecular chaperone